MATGAAGDGLFRAVYEGCISGNDTGIRQRPYHRNCSCALHDRRGDCSHSSPKAKISYPLRRAWSEGCLALIASRHSSGASSPALPIGEQRRTSLVLCDEGQ